MSKFINLVEYMERGQEAEAMELVSEMTKEELVGTVNELELNILHYAFNLGFTKLPLAIISKVGEEVILGIDYTKRTTLMDAIANGSIEAFKEIMKYAPRDFILMKNGYGHTALNVAVTSTNSSRVEIVKILINTYPEIMEIVDDQGRTPLVLLGKEWIKEHDAMPMIKLLVEKGAKLPHDPEITKQSHSWFKPIAEKVILIDKILAGEDFNIQNELKGCHILIEGMLINRAQKKIFTQLDSPSPENNELNKKIIRNLENLDEKIIKSMVLKSIKELIIAVCKLIKVEEGAKEQIKQIQDYLNIFREKLTGETEEKLSVDDSVSLEEKPLGGNVLENEDF